jgi:hypothetical protein
VLLAAVQKENEQLRKPGIDEPGLEEGGYVSSGIDEKQIAEHAKPSKPPRR